MSLEDKTTLSNNHNGPPSLANRVKPSLLQTRRHSWFGASQEAPAPLLTNNRFEKGIYDIQEESNEVKEESNTGSWWSIQKWSRGEQKNDSLRQRKTSSTASKKVSFSDANSCDSQRTERCGSSFSSKNGSIDKSTTPKRRSGFGSWLARTESRDSVFADDNLISSSSPKSKEPLRKQPSFERSSQRRATVHYSSNGRPSLMDLKRQAFKKTLKTSELKALEQFKDVGRDFIVYRLRQRNMANRVALERPQSKDRWLTREMIFIFNELEKAHKIRFSDISKQIGITLRSEDVLRKVFFELSGEIITTEVKSVDQNGVEKSTERNSKKPSTNPSNYRPPLPSFGSRYTEITWGRLCAVLAVAGGLAVDCVQQGHADLVNYIIEFIGDFAKEEDVLPWVVNQGGWEGLREMTFETKSRNTAPDACYLGKVTNMAMAFVFCTVTSVVAALAFGTFARLKSS